MPVQSTDSLEVSTSTTQSVPNSDHLSGIKLNSRLSSMEQRMDMTVERLEGGCQQAPSNSSERATVDMVSDQEESDAEDDAIIPSAHMLKGSKQIQEAVDPKVEGIDHTERKRYIQVTNRGPGANICKTPGPMAPELCFVRYCKK